MSKVEKRSLAEQVYDYVKNQILSGRLVPGQKIAEESIAEELGVSRTPIREAIRKLVELGLVDFQPRSWAKVTKLNDQELDDLKQVRSSLETMCLASISDSIDLKALESIQNKLEKAAAKKDWPKVFELDSLWHLCLAEKSGNKLAVDILHKLDAKVQLSRLQKCTNEKVILKDIKKHRSIMSAFSKNKIELAASLLKEHIENSGK